MGHDSPTSRTFVSYFSRNHQVNEIFLEIGFNKWILQVIKQRGETEEANETIILTVQVWKIEIFDISMILFSKCSKGKVHRKKSKKRLTSVSFAFTHTYTLEKLTLLLFSPKGTWKILKNESIAV